MPDEEEEYGTYCPDCQANILSGRGRLRLRGVL